MKPKAPPRSKAVRHRAKSILREQVADLTIGYLEILDTARALTVHILFSNGEDAQLAQLSCNPHHYDLPAQNDVFRRDYAATKLLSKWDGLKVPWDPKDVAVETALAAENVCAKTNRRILRLTRISRPLREPNARGLQLLLGAQKIIRKILGCAPIELPFTGWSNGRTTMSKAPALSALEKFWVKPDITASALPLGISMLRDTPLWGQQILQSDGPVSMILKKDSLDIQRGNFAFVVPKNAKTGRFCCYEPHLNICLQLSASSFLRRRLLTRVGIDIRDQSHNRRLALQGSIDGLTATIDLKSASDTIARELVKFLLPEDWYHLLDRIRSKETNHFGDWLINHKFSSMGNGFTFELQTIIFYSLCKSVGQFLNVPTVVGENTYVYGDDIIVPSRMFDLLVELLAFCGFTVNVAKSFVNTPFRESCGLDSVSGWVITPPMIRPESRGLNLSISFHNRLRDYCRNSFGYIPGSYQVLLSDIRSKFPGPFGPSGYGDGHYHVNFDEATPRRALGGWEGYWFKTRKPSKTSRLHDFMDGNGKYHFRSKFGTSAILAATFAEPIPEGLALKLLHQTSRDVLRREVRPAREFSIEDTLARGGTYTKSLLRTLSREWESLEIW